MKKPICYLVFLIVFISGPVYGQEKFSVEDCMNRTFRENHLNRWMITNMVESSEMGDSFILTEGRRNDTAYTDIEGIVSVLYTANITLIAEHDEKTIYLLPYRSKGKSLELSGSLPDSIGKLIENDGHHKLDSTANNIYSGYINGENISIGINPSKGLLEYIELTSSEMEETEDENGFIISHLVKRRVKYSLLSSNFNKTDIQKIISLNRFISVGKEDINVKKAFFNYELVDLTHELEN